MIHPKHIVAVSGLISHPNGKILLIRGPRRGWEFPGGQVEEGENLIEAFNVKFKKRLASLHQLDHWLVSIQTSSLLLN